MDDQENPTKSGRGARESFLERGTFTKKNKGGAGWASDEESHREQE